MQQSKDTKNLDRFQKFIECENHKYKCLKNTLQFNDEIHQK